MKMKRLVVIMLTLLLVTGVAFAKNYEANKKAGDYDVTMVIDKNPPVVGDNAVTVTVKDQAGKVVNDAKVVIDYSMPAMPGMPAMNYKTDAQLKGDDYKATINLSMAGAWNVAVKITRGSQTTTAKFNVGAH
jgi:nitrogen fixation protein FixH